MLQFVPHACAMFVVCFRVVCRTCVLSAAYVRVCTPDSILQLSFAVADNENRCLEADSTMGPVNVYVDLLH